MTTLTEIRNQTSFSSSSSIWVQSHKPWVQLHTPQIFGPHNHIHHSGLPSCSSLVERLLACCSFCSQMEELALRAEEALLDLLDRVPFLASSCCTSPSGPHFQGWGWVLPSRCEVPTCLVVPPGQAMIHGLVAYPPFPPEAFPACYRCPAPSTVL